MADETTNASEREGTPGSAIEVRFEEGMAALEDIVGRLESGELCLEDALKAFEDGVALVRTLGRKLAEAEQRVEILSRNENGSLRLRPIVEGEL